MAIRIEILLPDGPDVLEHMARVTHAGLLAGGKVYTENYRPPTVAPVQTTATEVGDVVTASRSGEHDITLPDFPDNGEIPDPPVTAGGGNRGSRPRGRG